MIRANRFARTALRIARATKSMSEFVLWGQAPRVANAPFVESRKSAKS